MVAPPEKDDTYPFEALYRLARELHYHRLDVNKILRTALQRSAAITGATQGCIITFRDEYTVQNAHVTGLEAGDDAHWQDLLTRGLIGYVYHAQRVVIVHNIATDARWPAGTGDRLPTTGSAIGLPLPRGAAVTGVMLFLHPEIEYFDGSRVPLLEEIAALTTDALNSALDFRGEGQSYKTTFQNAVVPMLLTDLKGKLVDINTQAVELLGCQADQLIGQPVTTIHRVDLDTVNGGRGLGSLRPQSETTVRALMHTRQGSEIPALIRLRRLYVDGRDLIEWVEQDITAQMELEQLRRDLSAMVYHDMRGPLHTIRTAIHKLAVILANYEDPAVLSLMQVGIRSTRQLRRMIDSLLDVQRLEEGSAILDVSLINVHGLLADAIQLVQPLAVEAGQSLKFEIDDDLPEVTADSDMILRVVVNLLENAMKYTPTDGTIVLKAARADDAIRVAVSDSGPGVPPEMQSRIFDKFNRVKYKDAPKGVGLGLAFCRLAVNAHDGKIWVESEPGNGSSFIFTLPIKSRASDDDSGSQTEKPLATTA